MMRAMGRRMTDRRRPAARRSAGRSVIAVTLCVAGLVLASAFLGVTVQGNALARETAAVRAEIAAEQARRATLDARIELQNTPDYITQKARDYGYIGPNESLVVVQRDAQASAPPSGHSISPLSRVARWIAFFFGSR